MSPGKRAASQAANRTEFGSRINNTQNSPPQITRSLELLPALFKTSGIGVGKEYVGSWGLQYSPEIETSIFSL